MAGKVGRPFSTLPKQPGRPPGSASSKRAFRKAIRSLNEELLGKLLDRRRNYYKVEDGRAAYWEYNGKCAFCGKELLSHGMGIDGVRFTMYIPLENGGKIERDNLIPVCKDHKETRRRAPKKGMDRLFDFNTIPDLIERLTIAIIRDEGQETLCLLKREINDAIKEFTYTLQYNPVDEAYGLKIDKRVEGENSIGDLIEKLGLEATKELKEAFKQLHKSRCPETLRPTK